MLKILSEDHNVEHEFKLEKFHFDKGCYYTLVSSTQPGYELNFHLPYPFDSFIDGHSVSVYLFKNNYFAQKDLIEVRCNNILLDKGRIGYFVQLSSVFDEGILKLDKYVFSYIFYALGNIFFNRDFKQTKTPDFSKSQFSISDFFDDDIIILMINDQIAAKVINFDIKKYLVDLYSFGFYVFSSGTKFINESTVISENYNSIKSNPRGNGIHVLRVSNIPITLENEDYFVELFASILLKEIDQETRFLMLYQIVEVLISRILTIELVSKICSNSNQLEAIELKNYISEQTGEQHRITLLFNSKYTSINENLKGDAKGLIYHLLQELGFKDYSDIFDDTKVKFPQVFYNYRNKIVHNHRSFSHNALGIQATNIKMRKINFLLEMLIIQVIITFKS